MCCCHAYESRVYQMCLMEERTEVEWKQCKGERVLNFYGVCVLCLVSCRGAASPTCGDPIRIHQVRSPNLQGSTSRTVLTVTVAKGLCRLLDDKKAVHFRFSFSSTSRHLVVVPIHSLYTHALVFPPSVSTQLSHKSPQLAQHDILRLTLGPSVLQRHCHSTLLHSVEQCSRPRTAFRCSLLAFSTSSPSVQLSIEWSISDTTEKSPSFSINSRFCCSTARAALSRAPADYTPTK